MSLPTIQQNIAKAGTCPHGAPLGSCPICNGMSGGGQKKADFSAKPGEMSWNECAAIGAFLKAQKNARLARQQDAENFVKQAIAFQNSLTKMSERIAQLSSVVTQKFPPIVAKPLNFALGTILGGGINFIKNLPANIQGFIQNVGQKFADISDKVSAVLGEIKTAIEKKISEPIQNFKKKLKSLFSIFGTDNTDNDDKQIDEEKKAFKLKTFIHELYQKLKKDEEKELFKD